MTVITYVGPCKVQCPLECEVPKDTILAVVPIPRHNWPDVLVCPNDCGLAFLIMNKKDIKDPAVG